ncbi:MAG TPA: hypothetical protein VLZ11_00335 [Flavobacterium sp.]|nr:hypothetical protein [Flavobacterium sp.]
MASKYKFILLLALSTLLCTSCSSDDTNYQPINDVSVDLDLVPYAKLSDYNLFAGNLSDLIPSAELLLYRPHSELFVDYAHKSRYVWMPKGTKATFVSENDPLQLPVGSILIKNLFYDAQQLGNKRNTETRLMINTNDGWIFANYVWNEAQTEAYYDTNGGTIPLTLQHNTESLALNYMIPSTGQCINCHSKQEEIVPIGIKPIHLNNSLNGNNQLQQWIEKDFLENNLPQSINAVVDYTDTSASLNERVRAYFDIQCAYCHNDDGAAYYVPLRMNYHQTVDPYNMGVCMRSAMPVDGITRDFAIDPQNPPNSTLLAMMNTNNPMFKMPRIGRSTIHQEGVALIEAWIDSLEPCE